MWSVNGNLDGDSAGDPDLWWIELKAAPAEDHFVTNRGGDLNELLAEADRAATDGDVLGSEVRAKMPGQRGLELHAAVVGVAVDRVGSPVDGGTDAGQRAEHGFVAGQLDGARHRFAGHINRQPSQLGSQAGGHVDSICGGCVR